MRNLKNPRGDTTCKAELMDLIYLPSDDVVSDVIFFILLLLQHI